MYYCTCRGYQGFWKGIYIIRIGNYKLEKGCKKLLEDSFRFLKYWLKML